MTTIGIYSPHPASGWRLLFDRLGQALDVSFEERGFGDDRGLDGWVVLCGDRAIEKSIGQTGLPCYVVLGDEHLAACGSSARISFSDHHEVPDVLRSRELEADEAIVAKALPQWLSDTVPLAFKNDAVIWACQRQRKSPRHYVSLPLPQLKVGEPLFAHFSGSRCASLLPLVAFVRSVSDDERWDRPPLQATIMFDDPNLHWPSYGFVDYLEMVRHAMVGNYHVAFATIPLDAWFVHATTCAIFKSNGDRISLLCHGNDHVSNELGQTRSADAMHRLLRQAVSRIGKMETRTGLSVSRVMAPPHGACSETAIVEMARVGFEAVCVSRGSLRHHNPNAPWTQTIGMRPADQVAGLPVIPRFGLTRNCRNDVLIAAVLRQPIVMMTHHQGVADGYGLLDEMASLVNSLGQVAWRDMQSISRSLYARRVEGETLCLKMFTKRISVVPPEGVRRIRVECPPTSDPQSEQLSFRYAGASEWSRVCDDGAVPVGSEPTAIEVAFRRTASVATPSDLSASLAPIARRVMTEVRDRALPPLRRIARKR